LTIFPRRRSNERRLRAMKRAVPPAPLLRLLRNPVHAISLGGGLGLMPWAPGTFGTLPGFALAAAIRSVAPGSPGWAAAGWLLCLLVLGTWCAGRTARALGLKDPAMIVCDEYLAFAGLLLLLPSDPATALWAFLCFRLFDVTKPFPVGWADRQVGGGVGIMLDDVLAAVWAWVAVQVLHLLHLPGGP
jgi:phosphatidylglycerophosphatase A